MFAKKVIIRELFEEPHGPLVSVFECLFFSSLTRIERNKAPFTAWHTTCM